MLLNVVGGLIVGVMQHNMELAQAAKNYTLLTIGDGLVRPDPRTDRVDRGGYGRHPCFG